MCKVQTELFELLQLESEEFYEKLKNLDSSDLLEKLITFEKNEVYKRDLKKDNLQ